MPKYARPRITLVIEEDVAELVKQLAQKHSLPTATFAASIFNKLVRDLANEEGLLGKQKITSDRKT